MVRNEKKLRIVLLVYYLTSHNWWLKIRLQSMVRNNVLNECKVFSIRAEILSIAFSKFGSEQSNVVCECKSISSHSWLIFKMLSSTRTPNSTQPKSKRDTPRTRSDVWKYGSKNCLSIKCRNNISWQEWKRSCVQVMSNPAFYY